MPTSHSKTFPDWRQYPSFSELLNSPANSDWLKALLLSGIDRDPVDTIRDFHVGLAAFQTAFDRTYRA